MRGAQGLVFLFLLPAALAALSGMGVGGGGLFMIYLSAFSEMEWLEAQALNLTFFLFASGAALLVHLQKRKIFFGAVALMTLCGIVAGPIGAALAFALPSGILRKIFGYTLIVLGILSFFRKNAKK